MKLPILAAVLATLSISSAHAADVTLNLTGSQVASLKIYSGTSMWGTATGVYLPTGATGGCASDRALAPLHIVASDTSMSEKDAGAAYTVALANHTTLLQSKLMETPLTLYIFKDDVTNECTLAGVLQDA